MGIDSLHRIWPRPATRWWHRLAGVAGRGAGSGAAPARRRSTSTRRRRGPCATWWPTPAAGSPASPWWAQAPGCWRRSRTWPRSAGSASESRAAPARGWLRHAHGGAEGRALARDEAMADLVYVALAVGFFVVMLGYAVACEKL